MSDRYRVTVSVFDRVTGLVKSVEKPVGEILIRYASDVADKVLKPSLEAAVSALF